MDWVHTCGTCEVKFRKVKCRKTSNNNEFAVYAQDYNSKLRERTFTLSNGFL